MEVAAAEVRRVTQLAEQLGNENGIVFAVLVLGEALKPSALEEATALFERSLSLSEPLGVENTSTQARRSLITAYTAVGRPLDALALAGPSLVLTSVPAPGSRPTPTFSPPLLRWHVRDGPMLRRWWSDGCTRQAAESLGEAFGFGELTLQLGEQLGSAELDRILAESASLTQPAVVDRALDAIEGLVEP